MKKILYPVIALLVTYACTKDLDQYPHIEDTSKSVYANADNYINVLAKCYASYVTAGQGKGGADPDLSSNMGYDYMRCYFNLQEAGTEELASTWIEGDKIGDLTFLTWDANDPWVADMYYRCYYSISLCNEFLKHCTDGEISGFTTEQQAKIKTFKAEARFLRALSYFHAMDLFRNIPYADENTIGSSKLPPRWEAPQIFSFIESELKSCSTEMLNIDDCPYGRAPRAAAWMLLARMYLNAGVYINTTKYDSCMVYSQKVINEGYALDSDYGKLFNADNNKRVGRGHEIIYPLVVDHTAVVSWGATTYLICGEGNTEDVIVADSIGVSQPWSMFRIRREIPMLFDMVNDKRANFITVTQSMDMPNGVTDQSGGYYVVKWSNKTDANVVSSNTASDGVDTDYPMFRLADAYLMYAESAARANKNLATALTYVNNLRTIRNVSTVTQSDLTASVTASSSTPIPFKFFLDERGRELYWECVRRTDLIRFGCFTTGDYLWQWKGNTLNGKAVDAKFNIYPIPASEISANPNLYNTNY